MLSEKQIKEVQLTSLMMASTTMTVIDCDKCSKRDEVIGDWHETIEAIYHIGWREKSGSILCPKCRREYEKLTGSKL